MRDYFYAVYVQEPDHTQERLIWKATDGPSSYGREYFIGGSGIAACVLTTAGSAHALIRKARKDFHEDAQFYVRKIWLTLDKPVN
jgi:hypothetical protein